MIFLYVSGKAKGRLKNEPIGKATRGLPRTRDLTFVPDKQPSNTHTICYMFRFTSLLYLMLLSPLLAGASTLIDTNSTWKYFEGFSDASSPDTTAWRANGFDDSSWSIGQSAFYYENQPTSQTAYTGNTLLSDMNNSYSCIFMRQDFFVANPSDLSDFK